MYDKMKNAKYDISFERGLFPTVRVIKNFERGAETKMVSAYRELVGNPEQIDMSLDRLLKTLSFFHVVKRLEKPWSKEV